MRRFALLPIACLLSLFAGSSTGDDQPSIQQPQVFARSNYVWPFAQGPHYGETISDRPVRTVVGSFDLDTLEQRLPAGLKSSVAQTIESNPHHYIVQSSPRSDRARSRIESAGGYIVDALAVDAWIVRVDAAGLEILQADPALAAVVPYHPALKLHPELGRTPMLDAGRALSATYRLNVIPWPGEGGSELAAQLERAGATVVSDHPGHWVVEAHASSLVRIAHLEAVRLIIEDLPIHLLGGVGNAEVVIGPLVTPQRPYNAAGIDGGGIGGAGTCSISTGPCTDASDCNGIGDVCTTAPQVLLVIDTGIQLDAADLSETSTTAGIAGPAHRKVRRYERADVYGGSGDFVGCDDPLRGGTHGHFVAANALGNATDVEPGYGNGFGGIDVVSNLDGIAPRALLVSVDAQVTPRVGPCTDPSSDALDPGDLFDGAGGGVLEDVYLADGARVTTLAWGSEGNLYSPEAIDLDNFLVAHPDAVVVAAARGLTTGLSAPATAKNVLGVGRGDHDVFGPGNRTLAKLTAPLDGNICRTSDDDQADPVECTPETTVGYSVSAALVSGAALLVRDYFAQGFYPDGTDLNPGNAADTVPNVSGPLVRAVLVNSARFDRTSHPPFRHNELDGYGAVQLSSTLPLQTWSASPTGLAVVDGAIGGGASDLAGLTGTIDATVPGFESTTLAVCDSLQQLRITLAWNDEVDGGLTGALVNDLDLELLSPSGKLYRGNYFTDDDDGNGWADPLTEDCPRIDGVLGRADSTAWSTATCARADMTPSPSDVSNTIEAIMLSPDYFGDNALDPDPADDNQIETGDWTLTVRSAGTGLETAQGYAIVVSGGLCGGSAVSFDRTVYSCNGSADVSVIETVQAGDDTLDASIVASRLRVEVYDGPTLVDCEGPGCASGGGLPPLMQPDPMLDAYVLQGLLLTSFTARDPGNGVLDVRDGDRLRVVYADRSGGMPDPNLERISEANVVCRAALSLTAPVLAQFGDDVSTQTIGGCERSARGLFEFGFPDRYLDADESVSLRFAFSSFSPITLDNVRAELRCVEIDDVNAPEDCRPGSNGCADPDRIGNPPCAPSYLTIANPVLDLGPLPPASAMTANFNLLMGSDPAIPDGHQVEFVLELTAESSGFATPAVVVSRQTLDVDEQSLFYSTDFPTGGVEIVDLNNNETVEDPSSDPTDWDLDYRFETRVWSDLTAGGAKNALIQSPWNFDRNDGGFTSGIGIDSSIGELSKFPAQWGEDLNFNNLLDGTCAIGRCSNNPGQTCLADVQCGGGICEFFGQGFCEVATATQCETNADCPTGDYCDLVECFGPIECVGLAGLVRCVALEEDRDPFNFTLDRGGYSTGGGCGWQSRAPGTCTLTPTESCYTDTDCNGGGNVCDTGSPQTTGGIWHTGDISTRTPGACVFPPPDECEEYDTIDGTNGDLEWHELLLTPEIERVNGPDHQVEILQLAWNQAVDLRDANAAISWDLDPDLDDGSDLFDGDRLGGPFGYPSPFESSNGPFPMFAPIGSLTPFASFNGTLGNNRVGQNACYFEGPVFNVAAYFDFELASPPDDDLAQGRCPGAPWIGCTAYCTGGPFDGERCSDIAGDSDCPSGDCRANDPDPAHNDCAGTDTCSGSVCTLGGTVCGIDEDCWTCSFVDAAIDDYVTANGPIRNYDSSTLIDRYTTLTDRLGVPVGSRFQAALGFHVYESDGTDPADPGYGWGIDDVVLEWREFALVPDAVDCTTGACASIDIGTLNAYAPEGLLRVSVLDPSPSVNDCNDDGDVLDVGIDDTDCDDDGTPDVRVRAETFPGSAAFFTLNQTTPGVYEGSIPYGIAGATGVLAIADRLNPPQPSIKVTIEYVDRDDGTGQPCGFGARPETVPSSTVRARATIYPGEIGDVRLAGIRLSDNGDNDGWADTRETVEMTVRLLNPTDMDLSDVRVFATSSDPNIACFLDAVAVLGDLAAGETRESPEPIRFAISDVDRTTLGLGAYDSLAATIDLRVVSGQFEINRALLPVTLELDLDAANASSPTTFFEGFEDGTFGGFGDQQNLDATLDDLFSADGYRCQYSDPDRPGNFTTTNTHCWPGANPAHADAFWWEVAGPSSIDGGRAFSGIRSLYYGTEIDATQLFTTPTGVLEAIGTTQPIDLGWEQVCDATRTTVCTQDTDCPAGQSCVATSPELSFKHQISLLDTRFFGGEFDQSLDAGVVQVQIVDDLGAPLGDWTKLQPFLNPYGSRRYNAFNLCTFDPVDDGNNEDDYFDPLEPAPSFGPSSTCFPEPVFAFAGRTDDGVGGSPAFPNLGRAPDGPALDGAVGVGWWIEVRFDLSMLRGQRIRLRFLMSATSGEGSETWRDLFGYSGSPNGDDGWWIDDVRVTDVSTTAAILAPDTKDNSALPVCSGCGVIAGSIELAPAGPSAAPGQPLELNAANFNLSGCLGGTALYRFWIDGDGNGMAGDAADRRLRDWSTDPTLVQAPAATTVYLVEAGCSSDLTCVGSATATRWVTCPISAANAFPTVTAPDNDTLVWSGPLDTLFATGDLLAVSVLMPIQSGAFAAGSSLDISGDQPAQAQGFWYLFREDVASGPECNGPGTWSSGGPGEVAGRETLP